MQTTLSPEARVMLRPFSTYSTVASEPVSASVWQLWLRRPGLMLLTLGAFVALSAAGRMVLWHAALAALFWLWAPIFQLAAAALTVRLLSPRGHQQPSLARSVDLYFMGHGAWYLLLLSLVVVAYAAPDVYAAFTTLLRWGILPVVALVTIVWSIVITYAFFRSALSWPRGRSWAGLGTFYGLIIVFLLAWYVPTGQLLPAIKGL